MSLAVYSLEVTTSGSLSSPRLCRLESWLEREDRLEAARRKKRKSLSHCSRCCPTLPV